MTPEPGDATVQTGPAVEAPDAELVEFLGGEVESPASPSEPKAPAPAEQPDAETGAQQRDPQGRFTKADAPAATDAPPAEAAETTEVAPSEPTPPKPFSYRAYGAEHAPFTGAVETPEGGVQIPPEAVPTLRQFLAEGHNAESRRRQFEHQQQAKLGSARRANVAMVQQAELTLGRLAQLRRNPEALQDWFRDLDRNWAVLEAEVERDAIKAQLTEQNQAQQERAMQQQAETLRPVMRQTLEHNVAQMIAGEMELRGLDASKMSERLWGTFFDRIFTEAAQDDPSGRFRKGEILVDYDAIRAELQYEASLRRAVPPTPKAPGAPKVQQKPVAPPPVVPSKGAGARAAPKVPTFKNTQDADEWFEKGGYNEL